MPLFTVTMKSNGSTARDRLSRAIHDATIAAGYSEDDSSNVSFGWDQVTSGLIGRNAPLPRTKAVCGAAGLLELALFCFARSCVRNQ